MPTPHVHIENEIKLFRSLVHSDEEAYTRIFHLFTPRLFPYILKITKDEHLAKELLQETFVKLWQHRANLNNIDRPDYWLFRIAANVCLSYLRTQSKRHSILQDIAAVRTYTGNDVTEYVDGRDVKRMMHNAVNALPPRRQQIFRLSREEGYSHKQIAGKLNISMQTVKNQIAIAIRSIQEFMNRGRGFFILFCLTMIRCT